jgi:hypothetical protein
MNQFFLDQHLNNLLDVPGVLALWAWGENNRFLCGRVSNSPVRDASTLENAIQRIDTLLTGGSECITECSEIQLNYISQVVFAKREHGVTFIIVSTSDINISALKFMLTLLYRKIEQALQSRQIISGYVSVTDVTTQIPVTPMPPMPVMPNPYAAPPMPPGAYPPGPPPGYPYPPPGAAPWPAQAPMYPPPPPQPPPPQRPPQAPPPARGSGIWG